MSQRIQLRRTKGWRKPARAVVVARPTRWGNPYRWSDYPRVTELVTEPGEYSVASDADRRRWAVIDFEAMLLTGNGPNYPSVDEIREHLAGRPLACWCPPTSPCHADVLLKVANVDWEEIPYHHLRDGDTIAEGTIDHIAVGLWEDTCVVTIHSHIGNNEVATFLPGDTVLRRVA